MGTSRTKSTPHTTKGGRLLERYIREHYDSIPAFCEAHKFDRIQVQRVINGNRWKRISVDFAFAIEKATGGEVPAKAWLSDTAKAA